MPDQTLQATLQQVHTQLQETLQGVGQQLDTSFAFLQKELPQTEEATKPETLLKVAKQFAKGGTQVELLNQLVTATSALVARVLLLIRKGGNVHGWAGSGFEEGFENKNLKKVKLPIDGYPELSQVIHQKTPVLANFSDLSEITDHISNFGDFIPFKSAFFPLTVKNKVAAILYLDSGADSQLANLELIELYCYICGLELTMVTSKIKPTRQDPAHAPQVAVSAPASPVETAPTKPVNPETEHVNKSSNEGDPALKKAKRIARVLVSDLKLYNEEAVLAAMESGTLYERLKTDLDRSYKHYRERVATLDKEFDTNFFKEELINQLAGGDTEKLGPLPF